MPDALERFLHTAKKYADTTAVATSESSITYHQLLELAKSYGGIFQHYNARKVLILCQQSAHAYSAMFGAWLADAQYCPVNLDIPDRKKQKILQTYKPDIIIHAPNISNSVLSCVDTISIPITDLSKHKYTLTPSPLISDSIAYTIFTSGSTGQPKGVQIQHKALSNYLNWVKQTFPQQSKLRWSQHPNIGFDLSVLDIFGALCFGATLYPLISSFDRMFPARFIHRNKIQLWNSTPSVFNLMIEAGDCNTDNLATLKLISFCGEPLRPETLESIFSARSDIDVLNTYGPTEATVSCTQVRLTRDNYKKYCRQSVCFGEMIDNMHYLIEGENQKHTTGELLLYGAQLSCGYLGRDDLTQEKFVTRIIDGQNVTCYKTGDIVEQHENQLYFKARIDDIVKINGKLIDLNGIEHYIRDKLNIDCHLVHTDNKLFLFIKTEQAINLEATRKQLSEFLEPHEMPTQCIKINNIPNSTNDKIDKKQLLALVT